jgi:hypothetical protein
MRRPITWPPPPVSAVPALPTEGISPRGVTIIVVCAVLHFALIEEQLVHRVIAFLR